MAVKHEATKLHFLVLFLVIASSCRQVQCIQEFLGYCGLTIDFVMSVNVKSGLLTMTMPDTMKNYQNPAQPMFCDVIIQFDAGTNLLLELYYLDIMPSSGDLKTCTTGLEIFDQSNTRYYGGRLCMEGWQWEERHRELQQQKVVIVNSPITFRLVSGGPYRGEGFKAHFNQFRPNWPCYTREFRCREKQRCISDDLTCDGWNDCEDFSDERIEAGCDLLTPSEICALIMGVILILGAVAEIVFFAMTYRRMVQNYGVRSDSKVPIAGNNYNMEPILDIGRRYNSQESIPSRYSRSTAHTGVDTVDKADLEKADRSFSKAGDNMSEKSYRSNPRRQIIQSLGTDVSSEPVKKIGRYSYGSRKGLDDSQTSLSHEKVEPLSGYDNTGERDSMKKERIGSRERLSDKGRDRYSRDRRSDSDEDRYGRDRDRRSDSDEDYDRDRSSDRKRRSSRERDRRRSGRYSDEDSDYDRDQDYRRRRRRSYDRYSDDSDYENERERRRRSREGYNRERYDDQDNSDTDIDRGRVDDRDKPSYRRDSKERGRDRYSRERYDTDDDTERSRDRGRDSSRDKDRSSYRRDSRERDRDRYVDLYDEDMGSKGGLYVDGYDDKPARQKSDGKRRGTSAERNSSRNGNRRSRSREYIQSRERDSPPLPLPPPYTEIDVRSIEPPLVESKRATQHQNLPPSPPFVATQRVEKQYPAGDDIRHTDKRSHKQSSVDRYKEPQVQKPSSSVDRYKEPQSQKRPPSEDRYREPQVQKPPPSEDRYREPQVQKPPPSAPPSEDGYREPQVQKPPPSEDRYREPHIRKSPQPVADTQQIELTQKQPPKEVDEVGRRRNTDNRRERYSRSRWTPKSKTEDAAPPDYEDVAPKSTFVGISYKEESV